MHCLFYDVDVDTMAERISLGLGLGEYLPIATAYNSAQNLELRFKASIKEGPCFQKRTMQKAAQKNIECLCALCDYGNGFGICKIF